MNSCYFGLVSSLDVTFWGLLLVYLFIDLCCELHLKVNFDQLYPVTWVFLNPFGGLSQDGIFLRSCTIELI